MNELLPFYFQKILKEISGVGHGHQKLLYLELNQSYWHYCHETCIKQACF